MENKLNLGFDFNKKCVVFGTTGLCVTILNQLLDDNWDILYVVSNDPVVKKYSNKKTLKNLSFDANLQINSEGFTIFSIANPNIIPANFLKKHRINIAINYHDSLLPKYAGINSTTWSIFNQEKVHGVTWHLISYAIDEGDILRQSEIEITEDETAYSLNLKCFQKAAEDFAVLLLDLNTRELKLTKQNLKEKTYYGRSKLPEHYGFLNFNRNGDHNMRLYRSLYFGSGDYRNEVASVKVWDGKTSYIVADLSVYSNEHAIPGYVYSVSENGLTIGCFNSVLCINKLNGYDGREIAVQSTNFSVGLLLKNYVFNAFELNTLSLMKSQEYKILNDHYPRLSNTSSLFNASLKNPHKKIQQSFRIKNSNELFTIQRLLLVILGFINDNLAVEIRYDNDFSSDILKSLVSQTGMVLLEANQKKLSIGDFLVNIQHQLAKNSILAKDLNYRYNLNTTVPDIRIDVLQNGVNYQLNMDGNRIIISLSSWSLTIAGYEEDKVIIDSIWQSCERIFNRSVDLPLDVAIVNYDLNLTANANQAYSNFTQNDNYFRKKTIHGLFEEQVAKTPNNIAVVYEDISLTYRELNQRANQLASYILANYQVKPDDLIALCLDRSEHMLIAILAVLKTGGAYVPMDPGYPTQRIEYILSDTQANLLLTNATNMQQLQSIIDLRLLSTKVLAVDSLLSMEALNKSSCTNPITLVGSQNLAYVIYTSGTTGRPKGVMVEHISLVNLSANLHISRAIDMSSRVYQGATYVFDSSVAEIFPTIIFGGALYIAPSELRLDLAKLIDYIQLHKLTNIFLTTRLGEELLNNFEIGAILNLKSLVLAGEKLHLKNKLINFSLINEYGPTENSVCSTYAFYSNRVYGSNIGKPLHNIKVYVLDTKLIPLPIGAIGELYIGGAGLARGYLNLPDLTAEKFIPNPFQSDEERTQAKNSRLYKTGDLVRWLADGSLEYIGRNDLQVKIRGYRIELGEIESSLNAYPGIGQSVVIAKDHLDRDGKSSCIKYLLGYYVADTEIDPEMLKNHLSKLLPSYMLPAYYLHLSELPLTLNGKLDKKALPEVQFKISANLELPRNELEIKVREIWGEVLGLSPEKIGINDDFFMLGGDSIVSIQLVSRLRQHFKLKVSVKDVFDYTSIKRFYDNRLVNTVNVTDNLEIKSEVGLLAGDVPLLPIQEWFFARDFAKAHHWNQSFMVKVPKLNIERLQLSIEKLVTQHDGLRLRYQSGRQYYATEFVVETVKTLNISLLTYREDTDNFKVQLQSILTQWQSSFNLETGPLYCISYVHGFADGSSRIFFAFHHLLIDTVSWRILVKDLECLYAGNALSTKTSSYRQWVYSVKEYASKQSGEKTYWLKVLSDYTNPFSIVGFNPAGKNTASAKLNKKQTNNLLRNSNHAYVTQINDILLAALAITLSTITNTNVNHILLEGHGRENIDASIDVSRTQGWFTTMFPVRLEVIHGYDLGSILKHIKEILRSIPHKGIGYGAIMGYNHTELPTVSFNYLGQFGRESENTNEGLWNITMEESGNSIDGLNMDANHLNLTCLINKGQFQIDVVGYLDQDSLSDYTKCYVQNLNLIITHCIKRQHVEHTMSDFNDFEPYVVVNPNQNKHLFLLPPAEGGAECYLGNICNKINPDISIYVFNNYFSHVVTNSSIGDVNQMTIEEIAKNYIFIIKKIQPIGPYNFWGWSFGGVVSYEIVSQLTKNGDKVNSLTLLDSILNYKSIIDDSGELHNSQFHLQSINYKYVPPELSNSTKILLLKAQEEIPPGGTNELIPWLDSRMITLLNHVVYNYEANGINLNITNERNFSVIKFNANHINWHMHPEVIDLIVKQIYFSVNE